MHGNYFRITTALCHLTAILYVYRSQALGISAFPGRLISLLAPYTSLMVRMLLFNSILTRKHSESAISARLPSLYFVESHISCQNFFSRIVKFGEDILIPCQAVIQVEDFQYGGFTLNYDCLISEK